MSRTYDYIDLLLYDDDGEETEADVSVYYTVQPREPDVGIMNDYAEVSHVSMFVHPWGNILFMPTEAQPTASAMRMRCRGCSRASRAGSNW